MKRIFFIASIAIAALATSCSQSEKQAESGLDSNYVKPYPQGFTAYKGINISHWLSQVYGWSPRATFFTEEDVKLIKSLGFDHLRLPIDEDQMWDTAGARLPEGFDCMKKAIEWCKAADMRIIIDLHIIRSHHFNANNGEGHMTLWSDTVAQNKFLYLWNDLQTVLHDYPTSFLAYELMNEPVAPDPEQWNALIAKSVARIRKTEPNRVIFVGANRWQTLQNIPYLKVPVGDSNIVITFHNYDPLFVTHHLATWTAYKAYSGPVVYPGLSVKKEDIDKQLDTANPVLMEEVNRINGVYNREVFDSLISIAVKRAKELNLSVYCGEFGCLPNVDTATRAHYYRDFVGVLNKYHIGRANWDYKGAFQAVGYDAASMKNTPARDTAIIKILTQ